MIWGRRVLLVYLVDGTRSLLPAGAAAGLHHIADILSGSQELGHVHRGLWPQRVSPRLVGSCHTVHPHLKEKRKGTNTSIR